MCMCTSNNWIKTRSNIYISYESCGYQNDEMIQCEAEGCEMMNKENTFCSNDISLLHFAESYDHYFINNKKINIFSR